MVLKRTPAVDVDLDLETTHHSVGHVDLQTTVLLMSQGGVSTLTRRQLKFHLELETLTLFKPTTAVQRPWCLCV